MNPSLINPVLPPVQSLLWLPWEVVLLIVLVSVIALVGAVIGWAMATAQQRRSDAALRKLGEAVAMSVVRSLTSQPSTHGRN